MNEKVIYIKKVSLWNGTITSGTRWLWTVELSEGFNRIVEIL